jgi:hypothetical protein
LARRVDVSDDGDGSERDMPDVMTLYIDDSGTRNPDRHPNDALPSHGHDWFALGGVLVRDDERPVVEEAHRSLCARWDIAVPLHSSDIRAMSRGFHWLRQRTPTDRERFYADVAALVTAPQLTAIACVVDRPGYNKRYREIYDRKRWSLCKTAFNVVVERAAKWARRRDCRLRVYVERSDKTTDARICGYYEALCGTGQPFDESRSQKYCPLSPADFQRTLFEFKTKDKSSRLMQIADVILWPMCIGGYRPDDKSYRSLRDAGTLIDCRLPQDAAGSEGIKYSCWELQTPAQISQSPG